MQPRKYGGWFALSRGIALHYANMHVFLTRTKPSVHDHNRWRHDVTPAIQRSNMHQTSDSLTSLAGSACKSRRASRPCETLLPGATLSTWRTWLSRWTRWCSTHHPVSSCDLHTSQLTAVLSWIKTMLNQRTVQQSIVIVGSYWPYKFGLYPMPNTQPTQASLTNEAV